MRASNALLPYCPTTRFHTLLLKLSLLPYCLTALLPYCLTALLPYCLTALLPYYRTTVLPYCLTTVLPYYRTTLLPYRCGMREHWASASTVTLPHVTWLSPPRRYDMHQHYLTT
jgi:hypothetical protein